MELIHKPYAKFKGWLRENGLIYKDIAELIGTIKDYRAKQKSKTETQEA